MDVDVLYLTLEELRAELRRIDRAIEAVEGLRDAATPPLAKPVQRAGNAGGAARRKAVAG